MSTQSSWIETMVREIIHNGDLETFYDHLDLTVAALNDECSNEVYNYESVYDECKRDEERAYQIAREVNELIAKKIYPLSI